MLESAEIGHAITKQAYDRAEPRLREALLNAQFDLSQARRGPLLLIISGVDGAGRGETANQLTAWMDPRHIRVIAFGPPTAEESAHPLGTRVKQVRQAAVAADESDQAVGTPADGALRQKVFVTNPQTLYGVRS